MNFILSFLLDPRFTAWRLALRVPLPIVTGVLADRLLPARVGATPVANEPRNALNKHM